MFKSLKAQTLLYAIAKYATVAVGIVISAILSRLLTPSDYGLVAVVTVFTTLFSTLCNVGLSTAVVQRQDLSEDQVNDIFSFSVYLSFALMFIFMLCAYPISSFYGNTVYVPVCHYLSLSVLFNSLNMIPNAVLMKKQLFQLVSIRMVVCAILSGAVAIVMAFMGFKYYALVTQSVLSALINFVWNMHNANLKMKIKFSMAPLKSVGSYSINQFLYNICNYFAQNLDNMLTGKLISSEALAYYNKSYTLTRYPINNIPHVITPILHPVLAKHQDEPKYIYDNYLKIVKLLSLLGVYISIAFYFAGEELIYLFFGSQWDLAVTPFKILSICVWAQMVNALAGSIYQSLGKTKEMFHSGIIHISISIICIIIGSVARDINILALFVCVSFNIKFFVESVYLVRKSFGYKLLPYYKHFLPDLLICVGVVIISLVAFRLYTPERMFISFCYKMLIISAAFLVGLIITGEYKKVLTVLKKK